MARRGKPSIIVSDIATTFKGADREIQNCIKAAKVRSFIDDLSQDKIEFKFIPPRSPHFGGIYEAGIKSVKYHLKRIVGQSLLTNEEMYTVLTLIEACLNSRPKTPLPESPSELEALTPGHFLIGLSLTATPEPDRCETKENRLSRWQRVEQIRQHFWKRWSQEYLTELQHRTKWKTTNQQHLSVGTIVLVQEDNLPPLQWRLGKIEALHPGKDNLVRVVSVKTKAGTFKRAVQKICVLPIDTDAL
jgi:hypothetical protein